MTVATAEPTTAIELTAAQKVQKAKAGHLNSLLKAMMPQMERALPRHLTAERLARVVLTAFQKSPALYDCDPGSFASAIMTSAQLGLEPDGVLGQAYLVPRKGKVCLDVGYKGYIQLARNSGEVSSLAAREVRQGDHFVVEFGLNEKLEHVPGVERGEVTHFYAVAHFNGGGHHFEVMTQAEVNAIRDKSEAWKKAGASTPWGSHPVEMGKKTVIRRLAKYLPLNVQKAAALADSYDLGRPAAIGDAGELVIDVAAEEPEPAQLEAGAPQPSRLDSFAAATSSKDQAPPTGDGEEGPRLLTENAKARILDQAKVAGLTVEQVHTYCAERFGGDLDHVPAAMESELLRWAAGAAASGGKGRRS